MIYKLGTGHIYNFEAREPIDGACRVDVLIMINIKIKIKLMIIYYQ